MTDSRNGSGWGEQRFGSPNQTLFYVVFLDGSVRPITYAINSTIFQNLGVINDGLPTGQNW